MRTLIALQCSPCLISFLPCPEHHECSGNRSEEGSDDCHKGDGGVAAGVQTLLFLMFEPFRSRQESATRPGMVQLCGRRSDAARYLSADNAMATCGTRAMARRGPADEPCQGSEPSDVGRRPESWPGWVGERTLG